MAECDTRPPWNDDVERDGSGGTYQYADAAELRYLGADPTTKPRLAREEPETGPQGKTGERSDPAPPSTQSH